jgi:hypothetical protein
MRGRAEKESPAVAPKAAAASEPEIKPSKLAQGVEEKAIANKYLLGDRALQNKLAKKAELDANAAKVAEYLEESPGSGSSKEMTEEAFMAKYGPEDTHPKLQKKAAENAVNMALSRHQFAVDFNAWYNSRGATAPMGKPPGVSSREYLKDLTARSLPEIASAFTQETLPRIRAAETPDLIRWANDVNPALEASHPELARVVKEEVTNRYADVEKRMQDWEDDMKRGLC